MSSGSIVEIIGAVVDVEFPRDAVPKIYDALKIEGTETTLEVQGQLGDGVVRTIAMGSSEGCLLYTSPSPRDLSTSRMPSSA